MRIAMTHVDLPSDARGGVAFQVHYLANAMAERGHDVTVFTFSPAFAGCRYHVRQYRLPRRLRRLQSFLLAGYLAGTDFRLFDVLHTHGDNYLLRGRHPQVRTFYGSAQDELRTAVSIRRRAAQRVFAVLERADARAADLNVGISESTRVRIPAVSRIVPCGVDLSLFHPGTKVPDKPVILFVGTTGGRKRGGFLAEVFQREVRTRFPGAELWAVAEAPLEGDGVVNFGKVSVQALAELYRRAWVFCLPSTYEGFGVPYIEALASGTAVVASPNPGAQEVLRGGEFGVITPDCTLGDALNRLLDDESARQDYTDRGLERAKRYSWENVTAQYEQIYCDLIARRSYEVSHAACR